MHSCALITGSACSFDERAAPHFEHAANHLASVRTLAKWLAACSKKEWPVEGPSHGLDSLFPPEQHLLTE